MYTFLGNVSKFSSRNVAILPDLFDEMNLRNCTYNCEVWGLTFSHVNSQPETS